MEDEHLEVRGGQGIGHRGCGSYAGTPVLVNPIFLLISELFSDCKKALVIRGLSFYFIGLFALYGLSDGS